MYVPIIPFECHYRHHDIRCQNDNNIIIRSWDLTRGRVRKQ